MKTVFWLVIVASVAILAFLVRHLLRKHAERERAAEARAAEFLAQMSGKGRPAGTPATASALTPAPAMETAPAKLAAAVPVAGNGLELQKLLFDAARKAGDAGEPALAIQLYGRLLARFPESGFATEVRTAAEVQKKKLVKA